MPTSTCFLRGLLCAGGLTLLLSGAPLAQRSKEPVDYVNPNIGGIGHLLQATTPWVQLPHAMTKLAPVTTPGVTDRYLAGKIYGFPLGGIVMMPVTGEAGTGPAQWASGYDHDNETVTPYYGSELLDKYDTTVEYTVARRAAYYRVAFPGNRVEQFAFNAGKDGNIQANGVSALSGYGESDGVRTYFYAEFSHPLASSRPWTQEREHGLIAEVTRRTDKVEIRVGISFISVEQAHKNLLADIPHWQFEAVKAAARETWTRALGSVAIRGGSEEQRTIFYTALYRTFGRMIDISEAGGIYKGLDGEVHADEGHPFYTDDGLWDTYRTAHPLQLLLDPARQVDMVRSYLRMYDQSGWLPAFPTVGAERAFMIGHHATPFIVDTYLKGYRGFDVEKAYAAMRKNALEATMLPWRRGPLTALDHVYQEQGFFPALGNGEKESVADVHPFEGRQAVSVTLENSYDDWALAQLAKLLHKDDDYALFMKRAHNYQNVFNARIGFMAPKTADGKWVDGFDPKLGGGQGGRAYFAECNSWVYSFHVQHDVAGLIALMGGREKFAERLDQLFEEQYGESKYAFLRQFPDATGLIGQYAQGDEPSFHIPYLYNYAGQPWKAQRRLRQIMSVWYNAGPLGICGDEDGGAMSSWYVFSAMGFYPVAPGRPVYVIGSPLFDEVRIKLGNGKTLTVTAHNNSARNKYIQSATLNGSPLNKPWFEHTAVANGGNIVFEMGSRPNKQWGSSVEAAPPSMSQPE
jgi:predicted alpha-1,2-mannosidase